VAHPRANGQVERANGMILDALRKKVFDKSEKLAGKMDQRATICSLEPANLAKSGLTWKHPILHGIWVGGSITTGFDLSSTQANI
jgi:hypothetical protein